MKKVNLVEAATKANEAYNNAAKEGTATTAKVARGLFTGIGIVGKATAAAVGIGAIGAKKVGELSKGAVIMAKDAKENRAIDPKRMSDEELSCRIITLTADRDIAKVKGEDVEPTEIAIRMIKEEQARRILLNK